MVANVCRLEHGFLVGKLKNGCHFLNIKAGFPMFVDWGMVTTVCSFKHGCYCLYIGARLPLFAILSMANTILR